MAVAQAPRATIAACSLAFLECVCSVERDIAFGVDVDERAQDSQGLMQATVGTAPQLAVGEAPRHFGWIDGIVLLSLLGLLWSALHFGRGMLIHFDPAAIPEVDTSPALIPYYAGRTLLRMWIAFCFSLVFAVGTGYIAAKNRPRAPSSCRRSTFCSPCP